MSELCLTLVCPPEVEEKLLDLLLLWPGATIFASTATAARSGPRVSGSDRTGAGSGASRGGAGDLCGGWSSGAACSAASAILRRGAALLGDPGRRSGRNRMMVRLLLIGIFAVVKAASAAQPMNPPGLMPTAIARPLFEQDPRHRRGAGRLGRGSARGEHSRSISV